MEAKSDQQNELSEPDDVLPSGLVLFRPGTDAGFKRRRLIFLAVALLAAAAVVWPIYPLASGIFPLIFGLPLSFAWVVMALLVVFAALLWLYWHDEIRDAARREG